jgi:hypothetical protein
MNMNKFKTYWAQRIAQRLHELANGVYLMKGD